MRAFVLGALAAGIVLAAQPAAAVSTPPRDAGRCFFVQDFKTWRAPDEHTLYIRVNQDQYYRLDLANRCAALKWPASHLITQWRGATSVCAAIDWDLQVAQTPGIGREACIVKTMTPLTAKEAADIPEKFRP